jgi:hypothetical protein
VEEHNLSDNMSEKATHSNVPKFASFRPKLASDKGGRDSAAQGDSDTKLEVHNEARPSSRHRHRTDRHREGSRSKEQLESRDVDRHRHRKRHRSRSREQRHVHPRFESAPEIDRVRDDHLPSYVVDRKGDLNNLVYGSVHRYSVPPFHRAGAGGIVGCPRNLKIDRDAGEDKGIVVNDRRFEGTGKREKYIFARNEKKGMRLLKVKPVDLDNSVPQTEKLR